MNRMDVTMQSHFCLRQLELVVNAKQRKGWRDKKREEFGLVWFINRNSQDHIEVCDYDEIH